MLRAPPVHVIPKHFSDMTHPGEALKGLGHAVLGWTIISAAIFWPIATLLTPFFSYLKQRWAARQQILVRGNSSLSLQIDSGAPSKASCAAILRRSRRLSFSLDEGSYLERHSLTICDLSPRNLVKKETRVAILELPHSSIPHPDKGTFHMPASRLSVPCQSYF